MLGFGRIDEGNEEEADEDDDSSPSNHRVNSAAPKRRLTLVSPPRRLSVAASSSSSSSASSKPPPLPGSDEARRIKLRKRFDPHDEDYNDDFSGMGPPIDFTNDSRQERLAAHMAIAKQIPLPKGIEWEEKIKIKEEENELRYDARLVHHQLFCHLRMHISFHQFTIQLLDPVDQVVIQLKDNKWTDGNRNTHPHFQSVIKFLIALQWRSTHKTVSVITDHYRHGLSAASHILALDFAIRYIRQQGMETPYQSYEDIKGFFARTDLLGMTDSKKWPYTFESHPPLQELYTKMHVSVTKNVMNAWFERESSSVRIHELMDPERRVGEPNGSLASRIRVVYMRPQNKIILFQGVDNGSAPLMVTSNQTWCTHMQELMKRMELLGTEDMYKMFMILFYFHKHDKHILKHPNCEAPSRALPMFTEKKDPPLRPLRLAHVKPPITIAQIKAQLFRPPSTQPLPSHKERKAQLQREHEEKEKQRARSPMEMVIDHSPERTPRGTPTDPIVLDRTPPPTVSPSILWNWPARRPPPPPIVKPRTLQFDSPVKSTKEEAEDEEEEKEAEEPLDDMYTYDLGEKKEEMATQVYQPDVSDDEDDDDDKEMSHSPTQRRGGSDHDATPVFKPRGGKEEEEEEEEEMQYELDYIIARDMANLQATLKR